MQKQTFLLIPSSLLDCAIFVRWHDASGTSRWNDPRYVTDNVDHPCLVHTVGWLIAIGKLCISVCACHSEHMGDCNLSDLTKIPRGCIQSIKKLNGVPKWQGSQ